MVIVLKALSLGGGQGKDRQWCVLEMSTQDLLGLRESAQFSKEVGVGSPQGPVSHPSDKGMCWRGRH